MNWIKDASKAIYSISAGQTIDGFQPLDFFHFFPQWYDLWIKRNLVALRKIGALKKSYKDLEQLLPPPSNLRALLQKTIPAYLGMDHNSKADLKDFTNFIARMLMESCPTDPFGLLSTPLHTPEQINEMVNNILWEPGTKEIARTNGQLITVAGSLVHGLYNDVVTDLGWDAYGPYEDTQFGDEKYSFLIRHFPNLQPSELWPESYLASVKEIKIFQLFKGVKWRINCVGCHTTLEYGNPIEGLKWCSVVADGKTLTVEEIKKIIAELGTKAENIYKNIRSKSFEELKRMVMLQESYQLEKIYTEAGMDWRPTEEMISRIVNKDLMKNVIPHGVFMTNLEEFEKTFGFDIFEKEVLNENS
ncbi:MAG: hypothetical protein HY918_04870 [Candidatus Doudnabacteria bacterium]|nr:hypothetical protein [Candidatus Doudnabacteria bacterium]